MCGRFALNRAIGQLRERFANRRVTSGPREFVPSNNIAPTTAVPVLMQDSITVLIWGIHRRKLVINARSETVVRKFAKDVTERRCVVPADGYFEWKKETKQPFFFRERPGELMFFAGLYTPAGEFAIITRAASPELIWIHDRTPLILTSDQVEVWESPKWESLLTCELPHLTWFPVARAALSSGHTGEECVREVKREKSRQQTLDAMFKSAVKSEVKRLDGFTDE
jgi:putative SOS response-associated peptidase YedK